MHTPARSPRSIARMNGTEALLAYAGLASTVVEPGEKVFDGADVSPAALAQHTTLPESLQDHRGGVNLRERNLVGASLRSAKLCKANLAAADLADAICPGIDLSEARLEGAHLMRTDLVGANLHCVDAGEANFTDALLEDAVLSHARLRFADFSSAILDGADLSHADLWGAKFRKSAADRVVFRNTQLEESSMVEADLAGADFSGARMQRVDLAGARLRNANLRDTVLEGANLAGADLSGAILPNLSLISCNLAHTRFAGAWLERTRMRAWQLNGLVGEEAEGDLQAALDSYVVLERNFQSLGISEDASWAYLRRRRVGRRLHRNQANAHWKRKERRAALLQCMLWLGDTLAQWLCDYGESLFRVARAFVFILFGFAVLYWLTGCLRVRDGFGNMHLWGPINYLLFSLDSMTTVGTSEVGLKPANELGIFLSSMETVLGTVLLGLFGFVLGARIRS